jgi:hypothetical protein
MLCTEFGLVHVSATVSVSDPPSLVGSCFLYTSRCASLRVQVAHVCSHSIDMPLKQLTIYPQQGEDSPFTVLVSPSTDHHGAVSSCSSYLHEVILKSVWVSFLFFFFFLFFFVVDLAELQRLVCRKFGIPEEACISFDYHDSAKDRWIAVPVSAVKDLVLSSLNEIVVRLSVHPPSGSPQIPPPTEEVSSLNDELVAEPSHESGSWENEKYFGEYSKIVRCSDGM